MGVDRILNFLTHCFDTMEQLLLFSLCSCKWPVTWHS